MQFDPYAEQNTEDPYPGYRWMRTNDPVHHNETLDVWFLSKYEDVLAALKDPASFSSARYLFLDQNPDDEELTNLLQFGPVPEMEETGLQPPSPFDEHDH